MPFGNMLNNPEKIKDLDNDAKVKLYLELQNNKELLKNKITEQKTKKEMLENKKTEIQNELFKEANVSSMEDLVAYVKKLQAEFDTALEEESILVSDAFNKLGL